MIAPEALRFAPIELSVIVALTKEAGVVYLYHTSSSGLPVAQPVGIPALAVAIHTEPELLVTPLVSVVAAEQFFFKHKTAYEIQILKFHLLDGVVFGLVVVKTRT